MWSTGWPVCLKSLRNNGTYRINDIHNAISKRYIDCSNIVGLNANYSNWAALREGRQNESIKCATTILYVNLWKYSNAEQIFLDVRQIVNVETGIWKSETWARSRARSCAVQYFVRKRDFTSNKCLLSLLKYVMLIKK